MTGVQTCALPICFPVTIGCAARVLRKADSVLEIGGIAVGVNAAIVLGDLRPMGAIAPICNPAISMAVLTAADAEYVTR